MSLKGLSHWKGVINLDPDDTKTQGQTPVVPGPQGPAEPVAEEPAEAPEAPAVETPGPTGEAPAPLSPDPGVAEPPVTPEEPEEGTGGADTGGQV